ncbi:MAG: hypothetical protein GXP28_07985 [Planctomycetes bacterium]|nr:hypothetical protein [Planctomycetota bacterium]
MPDTYLKLYRGPQETEIEIAPQTAEEDCVTVSIGEVLPLIADAVNSERTWLSDFEHDDITISRDLYEVLSAYQYYRRPSA